MDKLVDNAVLIQGTTLADIERMINRVLDAQLKNFKPQPEKVVVEKKLPRFIKRKDTAKMLGVSITTLDEWTKAGIIHANRISSRVYFSEEEIERALGYNQKLY